MRHLLMAAAIVLLQAPASFAESQHKVVVVHSWHDILWDRLWADGLESQLPADQFSVEHKFLDALRSDSDQLTANAAAILEHINASNPDAVVLGDDVALQLLGNDVVSDGRSTVFLGVNHHPSRYIDGNLNNLPNITGVLERPLYKRAMQKLAKTWPDRLKKVMLINEVPLDSAGSVTDLGKVFAQSQSTKIGGMQVDVKIASDFSAWQDTVKSAGSEGYDAIVFDSRYLMKDDSGNYVEPESELLAWTQANSDVPLFNFYEDSIGPEFSTGGYVISGITHGKTAGEMVYRHLEQGVSLADIKVVSDDKHQWIFSKTLLDKWSLDLSGEASTKATFVEDTHKHYEF